MRRDRKQVRPLSALILFAGMLSLASCEKEVHFNLKNEGSKVVVEGSIETGKPPVVMLSKSIGFFSKVDLSTLANSFIHDAVVQVSDGQDSIILKEYQDASFSYFYTVDSSRPDDLLFLGAPGRSYQLSIAYDNKTYTARTTIPFPKPLDSVWAAAPPPEEMPEGYPDARLLYAQYTDPDTPGNRVRYFTKRGREPFLPPLYSVYDDAVINGKTIQIQLPRGVEKARTYDPGTIACFYKGDTVVVKWCAIDKGAYDFWSTLEFSYGSVGNPFASPVEITTNIQGGALGVWTGYGTTFDTLYIRE